MKYKWFDGCWRDNDGEPMPLPEGDEVCMPIVQSDIEPYRSPIDGRMITSRSARRYDLESNGCVEIDPRPKSKRGFRNPSFALKRGFPLQEDVAEAVRQQQKG